jgi:hypothetical protein
MAIRAFMIVMAAAGATFAQSGPASSPATRAATEPAAMKILRDLEDAGKKYGTIRADIDYDLVNRELGDSEKRTGWVAYQRRSTPGEPNAPSKFRITFDTLKLGAGAVSPAVRDFIFDGQWMADLNHKIRTITEYQLAAKGQRIDPLRIGKGPFPLPFGQKAEEVLEHFDAVTRPPNQYDPNGTVYLRLMIRPEHKRTLAIERLEMWIDRNTNLPVKVRSLDQSNNDTTVVFKNIQTNRPQDAEAFVIPRKAGWQRTVRPLEEAG